MAAVAADKTASTSAGFFRRHRGDLLAVCFIALVVFLYLSPALKDGPSFGPADLGAGLSLLTNTAFKVPVHNGINGDQITQFIPWNNFDYLMFHRGEFPLWNPEVANGLPQLLNFDSGVLALPSLVGYLVPISISFLVTIAMKLLIAGIGTYLACRLLACRPLTACFGGVCFMLSGAFSGWLGWSQSGVFCWCGFLLAGLIACYRHRGVWPIALLSVSVAFCVFGGFPEGYVLIIGAGAVLLAASGLTSLVLRVRVRRDGIVRMGIGIVIGGALSAPLWLPGIPVLSQATRTGVDAATGLNASVAALLFAQGYDGLPIHGSFFFGQSNYYESAAYVGVIAIVLAIIGALANRRRPVCWGIAASVVFSFLIVYRGAAPGPIDHLVDTLHLGAVAVQRELSFIGFGVALLCAIGAETLLRRFRERAVQVSAVIAVLFVALVLAYLWSHVDAAGTSSCVMSAAPPTDGGGLSASACDSLRRSSLWWPTAELVLGTLILAAVFLRARRNGPDRARQSRLEVLGAGALLLGEAAFLLFAGVGINSYARSEFPLTKPVVALKDDVGSHLFAANDNNVTDIRLWTGFDLYPNINLGYGLDEFAMHDPIIPKDYFLGWPVPNSGQVSAGNLNVFVPAVTTMAEARLYGISYVLVRPGITEPGMQKVASIGTETLYRAPGVSRFSFSSGGGRVDAARLASDSSYELSVTTPRAATLYATVTDSPGWHASANGKAVAITRTAADLMSVKVPAGTTTITLSYLPDSLLAGIGLAICGALALLGIGLFNARSRRVRVQRRSL